MSGGVDSSVAAFLLKKQGYDVFGIFMKFWADEAQKAENACCSYKSFLDAKKIADKIEIPLYTVNFKEDFKKIIVDDFISQYKNCITPNPCVACNKYIKFDLLLQKAKSLGADFLATGHYVKITKGKNGIYHLLKSKDKEKDQSYFLYNLKQEQLKYLLFPVSGFRKSEVKEIAKENKLEVYKKPESQEICFVSDNNLDLFLKKYLKINNGNIIDINNKKIIGTHQGLPLYTIGQRKGIGLSGGPYYVVSKDKKKNILFVTNKKNDPKLFFNQLEISKVNFISDKKQKFPQEVKVKIRYRAKEVLGILKKEKNKYILQFSKPVLAATKGQSAVFYKKQEVVGGGIIKSCKKEKT